MGKPCNSKELKERSCAVTNIYNKITTRRHSHHKLLLAAAVVLSALAVLLFIWSYLAQIEELRVRYGQIMSTLTHWENTIASLENKWLIILVIFLLFALKALVSFYPMSALFIVSGMVFDVQYAMAINIAGLSILISIVFLRG